MPQIFAITLFVPDREKNARAVNEILTEFGSLFLGRMGIPLSRHCQGGCSSVISLVAQAESEQLAEFKNALDKIENVKINIAELPVT